MLTLFIWVISILTITVYVCEVGFSTHIGRTDKSVRVAARFYYVGIFALVLLVLTIVVGFFVL